MLYPIAGDKVDVYTNQDRACVPHAIDVDVHPEEKQVPNFTSVLKISPVHLVYSQHGVK